jgi:hypothetical protein
MKKVVVIADVYQSVGQVHRDVANALSDEYEFTFYDQSSFMLEEVKNELATCDICLVTPNIQESVIEILHLFTPQDQKKLVSVCHDFADDYITKRWSEHVNYGVLSDVLTPFFPVRTQVVSNGVNVSAFERKLVSGDVTTLGWCGAMQSHHERSDWVFEIARRTKMPVSIADGIPNQLRNEWYHMVDILLITSGPESYRETGPLQSFEAILSGTVAIGTNVGNFRHVPGPKFTTIDEAVQIVTDLKSNPESVKRLAEEQFAFVVEHYTYKVLAASWKQLFASAIESQKTLVVEPEK